MLQTPRIKPLEKPLHPNRDKQLSRSRSQCRCRCRLFCRNLTGNRSAIQHRPLALGFREARDDSTARPRRSLAWRVLSPVTSPHVSRSPGSTRTQARIGRHLNIHETTARSTLARHEASTSAMTACPWSLRCVPWGRPPIRRACSCTIPPARSAHRAPAPPRPPSRDSPARSRPPAAARSTARSSAKGSWPQSL